MQEPPALELALGMGPYATATPGIGGRIKTHPEDFVVDEVPLAPVVSQGPGKYTVAAIRARNWETNRLMQEIGTRLQIGRNAIFFAGTKDKRAVTTQYVAIRAPEDAVQALRIRDVEVQATFRTDRAPKIGELVGNRFDLKIRDVKGDVAEAARSARDAIAHLTAGGGLPNYFGLQRFGIVRPITHEVGRRLVAGDVASAFWTYAANPVEGEQREALDARKRLASAVHAAGADPAQAVAAAREALGYFPTFMTFERSLLHGLIETDGSFREAFSRLPRNLVTMFVYAYESLLFNRMITARRERGIPVGVPYEGDILLPAHEDGTPDRETHIPVSARNLEKARARSRQGEAFVTALLAGPEAPFASGAQGEIERAVLATEGVDRSDFVVRAMPEAGSGGTRREIHVAIAAPAVEAGVDEHGPFVRLQFFLSKGAYATTLLREVMKAPDPRAYG
ncbi:MAG: tRNA pseudouridine(13) synthase TruD [Thermoplasmatota archaeon]